MSIRRVSFEYQTSIIRIIRVSFEYHSSIIRVSSAVAKFRDLVQADLAHPRAMDDLHRAWLDYLTTEIKSKGGVNHGWRRSESLIEERNKTPTESDIEVIVCFHWYTSSVKSI